MKLRYSFLAVAALLLACISCSKKPKATDSALTNQIDATSMIKGDSMIYGLACEGSNDSVIIVYPFDGGDPVRYKCFNAFRENRIIGKPEIGDWIGLMLDPEEKNTATMIINLDELKATWTYPVMPTFKDLQHMSKKMQKRMEAQMIANMSDSLKETYLIPREYGFSLKRNHVAQSVGYIRNSSSIDEESPVEYPAVKNYSQWFMWNGKLILVSSDRNMGNTQKKPKIVFDTLSFVSMTQDSLILMNHGKRIGFHRKSSAISANAQAQKKAEAVDKIKEEKLK